MLKVNIYFSVLLILYAYFENTVQQKSFIVFGEFAKSI